MFAETSKNDAEITVADDLTWGFAPFLSSSNPPNPPGTAFVSQICSHQLIGAPPQFMTCVSRQHQWKWRTSTQTTPLFHASLERSHLLSLPFMYHSA